MIEILKRNHRKRGFTITEIMVTATIIAILSAIAIPIYMSYRIDAEASAFVTQFNIIKSAVQMYFFENKDYPPSAENANPTGLNSFLPKDFSFSKSPVASYYWAWHKPSKKIRIMTTGTYDTKLINSINDQLKVESFTLIDGMYQCVINI